MVQPGHASALVVLLAVGPAVAEEAATTVARGYAGLFELVPNSAQADDAHSRAVEIAPAPRAYNVLAAAFAHNEALRLDGFPISHARRVDLQLRPFRVTPDGGRAQVVQADGSVRFFKPRVALFSGFVADAPGSHVFLAVSPTMTNGLVTLDDARTYAVSSGDPRGAPPGRVGVAPLGLTPGGAHGWACHVGEPQVDAHAAAPSPIDTGASPQIRFADVFIEGDHELRALFDTAEDAADYVVTLIGAISDIYRRDVGVELHLPDGYVRIWETLPPWGAVVDHNTGVCAVMSHWGNNCSTPFWSCFGDLCNMDDCLVQLPTSQDPVPCAQIERAAVHLLTAPPFGGAAANFGGLCTTDEGYEVSSVNGSFLFPLQHSHASNYDPFVVAHEFGHSFNSFHTFDYDIPCDDGSGPDMGTIMSYCALGPEDVSPLGMRFHPIVQGVMRDYVPGVACLEVLDLQAGDYDHDGAIDVQDLVALVMCLNQGFESGGCYDMFDFDRDGALTPADYCALGELILPGAPDRDCNQNAQPDCVDIAVNTSSDCNLNLVPDQCDVDQGESLDCDGNAVPDECESTGTPGDINCDQAVTLADFAQFPGCLTGPGGNASGICLVFDFDADLDVDFSDFAALQVVFAR